MPGVASPARGGRLGPVGRWIGGEPHPDGPRRLRLSRTVPTSGRGDEVEWEAVTSVRLALDVNPNLELDLDPDLDVG